MTYYRNGDECVCVETGMPEDAVRVGRGATPREAMAALEATPIQTGGGGEAAALRWAASAWLDGVDVDDLRHIAVSADDLDDRMEAWAS